ncbi:MAG TPA: response regulator, partial [Candidatus Omnitrophota bacterium]|nr:response regulator [Candidatus Omnitrophota bacterium]
MTRDILESSGEYSVEISHNGDDGLKKAKNLKPDIILLDIMMSGKNGFEVAMNLKKSPDTRSIPVVFISGILKDDFASRNKALSGDLKFVSKTESPQALIDAIENS